MTDVATGATLRLLREAKTSVGGRAAQFLVEHGVLSRGLLTREPRQ